MLKIGSKLIIQPRRMIRRGIFCHLKKRKCEENFHSVIKGINESPFPRQVTNEPL